MIEKAWLAVGKWIAAYVVLHLALWGLRRFIKKIWGAKNDGNGSP